MAEGLSCGEICCFTRIRFKKHALAGVMQTTWNTAQTLNGVWALAYSAALNWGEAEFHKNRAVDGCVIASMLRKLDFPNGDYQNSGWIKNKT